MNKVVGIIANSYIVNDDYRVQASGIMNLQAVAETTGAMPLVVPSLETSQIGALLNVCDGFVFTGGRPNVHPSHYGEEETEKHGEFDHDRDALTLPLIRECVERGKPIMGICRGFQEFNVAFGGSLHPEIRELPGRMNHRMPPDGTLEEKFALRHEVHFSKDGKFAQLIGSETAMVNTLHGQGINRAADRIVIDGYAPDETPEALYIKEAPNFAMAVQWHPEWQANHDPVSRALYHAFGQAL